MLMKAIIPYLEMLSNMEVREYPLFRTNFLNAGISLSG